MSKSDNFKDIISSKTISGIPQCHYESYLHNFDNKYKDEKFYKMLVHTAEELLTLDLTKSPKYIFLCGTPGSGKTHYMVGLYRAMIEKIGYIQGEGAMFATFSNLAQEMISLFKENVPLRSALVGYEQSRWLFIDDFTSSERVLKEGSLEFNVLRDIIIDRYEKEYTLVASSNFNSVDLLPEINRLFGGYVMSRINNSKIIQFPNVDFRKVR